MSGPLPLLDDQRQASDARQSVWVSANAGSGKTFVLASRVLRLLLDGNDPDRLLCLTFTKAAAGEMANRIFDALRIWATASDEDLHQHLLALEGRQPSVAQKRRARTLFALALETPGGLKIQTIHAFCEALLGRFPFEADVPTNPTILDERQRSDYLNEARQTVLMTATSEKSTPLGNALDHLIAILDDQTLSERINDVLSQLGLLREWLREAGGLDLALAGLKSALGVVVDRTSLEADLIEKSAISPKEWRTIGETLAASSSRDRSLSAKVTRFLAAPVEAKAQSLIEIFTTSAGALSAESSLGTKAWHAGNPGLGEKFLAEFSRIAAVLERLKAAAEFERSAALFRLTHAVLERYSAMKVSRGSLDFDDQIEKVRNLLAAPGGAQWVHYKLDRGIDHILVDEAQDTSPAQWDIIRALASEFYAGDGLNKKIRTLFVVGDEKQSIYSFQGADPAVFSSMQVYFQARIKEARLGFQRVPLLTSFRTVRTVLDAVDRVFNDRDHHDGVISEGDVWPGHQATRKDQSNGLVEIWPVVEPQDDDDPDPWDAPFDLPNSSNPKIQNAERIAGAINTWLKDDATLTPGDILILVRKRQAFAEAINRSLKRRGIPVAGADRLALGTHIAVMDLVALGEFTLLPEDDLNLAALLKSPLCGLDDDDLIAIAPMRRGSLWSALLESARTSPRHQMVCDRLSKWRRRADEISPFRFYAEVLGAGGGRQAFHARMGAEIDDLLDEFLSVALAFERDNIPLLQGFLRFLSSSELMVKRDMDQGRDEVRVMTVHGSKGLEAKIVILADAAGTRSASQNRAILPLHSAEPARAAPLVWIRGKETQSMQATQARMAQQRLQDAEDRRLLYVALTRARDRLHIAGHVGVRQRGKGAPDKSWHAIVDQALHDQWQEAKDPYKLGFDTKRLGDMQQDSSEVLDGLGSSSAPEDPLPDWLFAPARKETFGPRTITPSSAWLVSDEDIRLDQVNDTELTISEGASGAMERGRLFHKLLQWLPEATPEERPGLITDFLSHHETVPGLQSGALRQDFARRVLEVIAIPDIAPVFSREARAEVPLIGQLERPDGEIVRVAGIIDRLFVDDQKVILVDFKTGRSVPEGVQGVSRNHVAQMATYFSVLETLYPKRTITAHLVYTYGPRLITLDARHFHGNLTAGTS